MRSLADKHISLQDKNVEEEINESKIKYPFHCCSGKIPVINLKRRYHLVTHISCKICTNHTMKLCLIGEERATDLVRY